MSLCLDARLASQCIILFVAAVSSPEEQEVEYDGAVSAGGTDESDCLRWIESEAEANARRAGRALPL